MHFGEGSSPEFANVLDVPVSYFFDEMPSNALSGRPMSGRGRKGFCSATIWMRTARQSG
jgi:hypothetical protein